MSTKNIALSTEVYEKLARAKGESESFSKAVDRILSQVSTRHTGADILGQLSRFSSLSKEDADTMKKVVEEHRTGESWQAHDVS